MARAGSARGRCAAPSMPTGASTLYSYGLYSYGLYRDGLDSYGRGHRVALFVPTGAANSYMCTHARTHARTQDRFFLRCDILLSGPISFCPVRYPFVRCDILLSGPTSFCPVRYPFVRSHILLSIAISFCPVPYSFVRCHILLSGAISAYCLNGSQPPLKEPAVLVARNG